MCAVPCQHCAEAPCLEACPVEGAIYRREDGLVVVDPQKCTGCRECLLSCPYDALFFNEDLNIVQKCTGCAHLLDDGWTVPRCVDICPTQALKFGDESEFAAEIAQATLLGPADETKPRVYYLNVPKRFIGGLVYDPAAKEIVEGARCTLVDAETGEKLVAQTRWLRRLLVQGPQGRSVLSHHRGRGLRPERRSRRWTRPRMSTWARSP